MPRDNNDRAAARADLCRFLAACYYQPAPEFAEEKVFDSMLSAASRIDPELEARARRLGSAFHAESLENLLIDYTQLFLGPAGATARPYGSVWLSGESALMQDSTMAVLEFYREGGFEIAEDFRELPDHIAAELEFLYLLIHREHRARRLGERDAVASAAGLRKRFLREHLGNWVGPFTEAMEAGARSDFYRQLAALTDYFIRVEVAGKPSP